MISKDTLKAIDPYVRRISGNRLYTEYGLHSDEFIGTVDNPAIKRLLDRGYESPPKAFGIKLQAVKTHPETGEVHTMACRKVPVKKPPEVTGTALEGFRANQLQYHLHLFAKGGEYAVFSHYEPRPDITILENESLSDAYERLTEHLGPTWDLEKYKKENWSYLRGIMDPELEGLVNE